MSITAPNQKNAWLSIPSRSSKPATNRAACSRSSVVARRLTLKIRAPNQSVTTVATRTNGPATTKKRMNEIPAVVPTMMFGTELIRVSRPPTFVKSPSTIRKPSIRLFRANRFNETPVKDPTMIMAVTLLRTAENTTVITP